VLHVVSGALAILTSEYVQSYSIYMKVRHYMFLQFIPLCVTGVITSCISVTSVTESEQ